MVLFSVWFIIQGIIQNTTCSVWFRTGYYSKYDLQRLVHYSGYYSKMARYYSEYGSVFRVLFKIIQNTTCSVWFRIPRIIGKYQGYYIIRPAASCSGFSVLFKIRPAPSGSLFWVLFKIRHAESGS